jgi:hypothetical protein
LPALSGGQHQTSTGLAMFFSLCRPALAKGASSLPAICSATWPETQTPPAGARLSRRAATLTPSPRMSPASTMTSPKLTPTRKTICSASGRSSLTSCSRVWISTALRVASTLLGNSATTLSPAEPKMRPPRSSITASMIARRSDKEANAASSSAPMSRL